MATLQEQVLKTSKEIIVKFIETGRVSPTSFDEIFRSIYTTVKETVFNSETEIIPQDNQKTSI
ncbi:conjugal transfer protein TraB [Candidatus Magnetomorum sp. HK-1]|nr:conjugal transfer protein TraB [Candidatus Magnetomorum sp. HK-1]